WRSACLEDIIDFLRDDVPATTARLQCRSGVVALKPTLENEYVKVVPSVPVTRFRDQILSQIRRTAAWAIVCMKDNGELSGDKGSLRRRLARIAAQFTDDNHWETYAAQGYSHHADGEFKDAVELYGKAIELIREDAEMRHDHPFWVQTTAELNRLRQR